MTENLHKAGEAVLRGCAAMCAKGYALGTAGNISARIRREGLPDLVYITPTSLPYHALTAEDLVLMDMDGQIVQGRRAPSIEWEMHRAVLQARPEAACVIHTHSTFATAAGLLLGVNAVPVMDIEAAMYLGGDIPVAPFAPPGSKALAAAVAASLRDRAGVILEGHGALALGLSMEEAMVACDNVERNCQIFLAVRAAGERKTLPAEALAELCAWSATKRGLTAT